MFTKINIEFDEETLEIASDFAESLYAMERGGLRGHPEGYLSSVWSEMDDDFRSFLVRLTASAFQYAEDKQEF